MEHHPEIKHHRLCRVCRGDLHEILDLGNHKLNDFPATPSGHVGRIAVPLRLAVCDRCTLVQLTHTTPPDWLYRTYWYRSSINEMMRDELRNLADAVSTRLGMPLNAAVLDIGANDGTLLGYYPEDWYRVGVDPAENLQEVLAAHCTTAICDYFPSPKLPRQTFDAVTAVACCYDLEDPLSFFSAIGAALSPRGIACVQFQDFEQQLRARAFDNVCHEHLEYYTLHSLIPLVGHAGLRVVDCETRSINGGSLRVWLAPSLRNSNDRDGAARVSQQLHKEAEAGLSNNPFILPPYLHFKRLVGEATTQILAVVDQARDEKKVIDLYGASTKGNILLQVLQLGPNVIRQAIDRSPQKFGYYTITGIPIVGEDEAKKRPADLWLCPIWQFKPSVLKREGWYLAQGGTIVFPLPYVEVVQGRR
jgi:SAM-dependent methyltransferase